MLLNKNIIVSYTLLSLFNAALCFFDLNDAVLYYESSVALMIFSIYVVLEQLLRKNYAGTLFSVYIIINYFFGFSFFAFLNSSLDKFYGETPYHLLNITMIYINLSLLIIIYVYNSNFMNAIIYNYLIRIKNHFGNVVRSSFKLNYFFVLPMYVFSVIIRLYLFWKGEYGYITTVELKDILSVPNFVLRIGDYGFVAYILIYLSYLYQKDKKNLSLLIAVFIIEFLLAFLHGFKASIIKIFIIPFLLSILIQRRFSISKLVFIFIGFAVAYSIIEPYRIYIDTYSSSYKQLGLTTSIADYYSFFSKYKNMETEKDINEKALERLSRLSVLVPIVEYKISHNTDDVFIKEIRHRFLLVPMIAFVPRFIWHERPNSDLGMRFVTREVFNKSYNSTTGFGVLGFSVCAGVGYLMLVCVIIGLSLQISYLCFRMGGSGFIMLGFLFFAYAYGINNDHAFNLASLPVLLVSGFMIQFFSFKREIKDFSSK